MTKKRTIYKYPIDMAHDAFILSMPAGAEILTVQVQREIPCIWALVDPVNPIEDRWFKFTVTGEQFDATNRVYVGTVQSPNQSIVLHLFEVRSE